MLLLGTTTRFATAKLCVSSLPDRSRFGYEYALFDGLPVLFARWVDFWVNRAGTASFAKGS